ncbi:MAG: FeoB-associated Cys-rich membrane protein [Clostridiales bacterium]|nr:FeoB-associated Cys-rich membrane protein [Clostridiales bacterium]
MEIIVIIAAVLIVGGVIVKSIIDRKKGKTSCGCDCSNCSGSCSCCGTKNKEENSK